MNQDPLSVFSEGNNSIEQVTSQIISEIFQKYNLDVSRDPNARQRIREAVEKAWKTLEKEPQAEINLPYLSAISAGPIHYQRRLTRADFEGLPGDPVQTEPAPVRTRLKLPDREPRVTVTLLIITGVIYIFQLLTSYLVGYDYPAYLGVKSNELIVAGQYWRLITPMFLHGSIIHLGFNMYALYILGRRIEPLFGSLRFLGLYLIAGITGNLLSFLLTPSSSLGSSTAIFGLLGAEGVFIYQHRKLFGKQFQVALRQIIQVALVNILIGLSPRIDNWGHIGGLLGGFVFSWFGGPLFVITGDPPLLELRDNRPEQDAGIVLGIAVLILIGLIGLVIWLRT
jgi:rhomboid protease GluP